jgi:hypothetical protein
MKPGAHDTAEGLYPFGKKGPASQNQVVQRALAHAGVIQRVTPVGAQANYYKEVKRTQTSNIHVDALATTEKTLMPITQHSYNLSTVARVTEETGTTQFVVDGTVADAAPNWSINPHVLQWDPTNTTLSTPRGFRLPVSCLETSEHILHHTKNSVAIPDYVPNSGVGGKSVDLSFKSKTTNANKVALDISTVDLGAADLSDYTDFDFTAAALALNEGVLVIDPTNPQASVHAVVVVGINTVTGQIIVAERNAGTTTGDNMYVDNSWLLNAYNSAAAFKASLGGHGKLMGKLVSN